MQNTWFALALLAGCALEARSQPVADTSDSGAELPEPEPDAYVPPDDANGVDVPEADAAEPGPEPEVPLLLKPCTKQSQFTVCMVDTSDGPPNLCSPNRLCSVRCDMCSPPPSVTSEQRDAWMRDCEAGRLEKPNYIDEPDGVNACERMGGSCATQTDGRSWCVP